jgi:hypothetical protein
MADELEKIQGRKNSGQFRDVTIQGRVLIKSEKEGKILITDSFITDFVRKN